MKNNYLSVVYDLKRTPKTVYPAQLIEYLTKRFKIGSNSTILEIGCGRCDFLIEYAKLGHNCYGVDREVMDENILENIKLSYIDISRDKLPYPDEYFDLVYHKSVLEHFYTPDNLMSESMRVLKKGGKLIILTVDWISQMKNFYEDYTHSRPYTLNGLNDLLKIYNLKNIETDLFYQIPSVWRYPILKIVCNFFSIFLDVYKARKLTEITKCKFFRWSVEHMLLGYGEK